MCCSVSPGVPVAFTDTVLYAAEVDTQSGLPVHVLGYQNKVQSRTGRLTAMLPSWFSHSGNAMILPFPAVTQTMSSANLLDTKKCPNILQDMANTIVAHDNLGLKRSFASASERKPPAVQVFAAGGIYTVVLAQDARDIPSALEQVPENKRPILNPKLFDAFARWYPNWTIALCCFNNSKLKLAKPLLWWYEPMNPEELFLPALDCHTGDIPDLNAIVEVDHVIAVGTSQMLGGQRVQYRDVASTGAQPYLCKKVIGARFRRGMTNGDFKCKLEDVRNGKFSVNRCPPIGA